MKIGDYVTVDEIMNQGTCRWVVLADLDFSSPFGGVKGGIIKCIADTKKEASEEEAKLCLGDVDTYLVSGTWEDSLVIGGVFAE